MPEGVAVAALQKLTTLDYPGVVSAMIYTRGCNFHCPYCHNRQLIGAGPGTVTVETVLAFLRKRAGLLDGLVISGGEPTLQPGLADFCREVKKTGYRIKLDSNGSRPSVLEALLRDSLIDYAAIDLKAGPDRYAPEKDARATSGYGGSGFTAEPGAFDALSESLELLRRFDVRHELRTTCVAPFVTGSLPKAAAALAGSAPWLLQRVRLAPEAEKHGLAALSEDAMEALASQGRSLGIRASVRE